MTERGLRWHCLIILVSSRAVSEDTPISPSEDLTSYGDLVKHTAAMLGLQVSPPPPQATDNVYDIVQRDIFTVVAP